MSSLTANDLLITTITQPVIVNNLVYEKRFKSTEKLFFKLQNYASRNSLNLYENLRLNDLISFFHVNTCDTYTMVFSEDEDEIN